ncbi:hypothetical protein GY45DRAFT_1287996 [Cubamyces sp. BRFM 1775]|nr:hypothetical protein GY45DRAFT_1287996 [Cubamyces sp. BRFM 1775]
MDALISYFNTLFIEDLTQAAMCALVLYVLLITFDREVNLFWNAEFTKTTVLFLLNRYASILKYPVALAGNWPVSLFGCQVISRVAEGAELIPHFVWAVFSALRVHALTAGHWAVTLLVFALSAVDIGANIYVFTVYVPTVSDDIAGCTVVLTMPAKLYNALLITSRATSMLSDVIVLRIIWYKAFSGWRHARAARLNVSLAALLLRDSSIYFLLLLGINVLHLVSTLTSAITIFPALLGEPLITILISRMMLNLRDADQPCSASNQTLPSLLSFVHGHGPQAPVSSAEPAQVNSGAGRRRSHDTVDDIVSRYRTSTIDAEGLAMGGAQPERNVADMRRGGDRGGEGCPQALRSNVGASSSAWKLD